MTSRNAARPDWPTAHAQRCSRLTCALLAVVFALGSTHRSPAFDLHFDYTSFDSTFKQAQFDVLNYPSINGNYMMTSGDTHRPEMVANGNDLAEFYNNFNADYNHPTAERRTPSEEAAFINTYTLNNSTKTGPRPDWLILNEISSSQWQLNPGVPSLSEHRTWVIDTVTALNDVYHYKVITYSPYASLATTANGASWQALAAKSYIAIESYQSGTEVWNSGTDYASRLAWAQSQYQNSKNTYMAAGVPASKLFVSEHFANNEAITDTGVAAGWGRAGLPSAADWDTVIQIRQDAILNVGFDGFLAYSWGGNGMGVTQAEQIQHEYYYRTRRVLPSQKPQWLPDSAINVNGTTIPLSWNQQLNWLGGVPNAAGAEANFWRTITTDRAVTLDGSKTVGTLTFDSPYRYTVSPGSGGSLIFDNASAQATLTSTQGDHTITSAVQLGSSLDANIDVGTFTIGGIVSGVGGIIKDGDGALAFNSTNNYAGHTIIHDGILSVRNDSLADAANVYLSSGATLNLNFTGNADLVHGLYFNGVAQASGIWGAAGSGAQFTSSFLTGLGRLNVAMASPPPPPPPPSNVIDDFEVNEGHFGWAYNASPSQTTGLSAATTIDRVTTQHQGSGTGSQLLNLVASGTGAWQLDHLSGTGTGLAGAPAGNKSLDATGYVGFWLKTDDLGITVRIGIDDPVSGNSALERGFAQNVVADNQWHLYQWNLENDNHWDAYSGGANGYIDAVNGKVTIDSIWLFGTGNAQIYLDNVTHNPLGLITVTVVLGDYNGDGTVDTADYTAWRDSIGQTVAPGTKADGNGNGVVDTGDFVVWRKQASLAGGSNVGAASVPEPAGVFLDIIALALLANCRLRFRYT